MLYCMLQDELLWAAVWMYKATKDPAYLQFIVDKDKEYYWSTIPGSVASWDNKFVTSQILLAQVSYTTQNSTALYRTALNKLVTSDSPGTGELQSTVKNSKDHCCSAQYTTVRTVQFTPFAPQVLLLTTAHYCFNRGTVSTVRYCICSS